MEKDKKQKKKITEEVIMGYTNMESPNFDPNGSWTGIAVDKFEQPIQDADDL